MRNRLDVLLRRCVELGSSDLHLAPNQRPRVRLHGRLESLLHPRLDDTALRRLLRPLLASAAWEEGKARGFWSFDYPLDPQTRFRVRAFRQQQGLAIVLHRLPRAAPRLAALGMPEAVRKLAELRRGLVLLAGEMGSGRSCSQAALLTDIVAGRPCHLLVLEDDAGFRFPESAALVSHRQLAWGPAAWEEALRASSGADAEVIALARLPSETCLRLALREAAAGRLVLACAHGPSAVATLRALAGDDVSLRRALAQHLAAVVWQRLLPCGQGGPALAVELWERNPALARCLASGDWQAAEALPARISFDASLHKLVEAGRLAQAEARRYARRPELFPLAPAPAEVAAEAPARPQAAKPAPEAVAPRAKPAKEDATGTQTIRFSRTKLPSRPPTRRTKRAARQVSADHKTTRIERPRPPSARRLPTRKGPLPPRPLPPIRRKGSPPLEPPKRPPAGG